MCFSAFLQSTVNSTALKIQTEQGPLTVISAYSYPYKNIMETLQELHSILTDLGDERVLICADLNAHSRIWGYANEDTRGAQVEDFLLAQQLYLLNETNSPPTFEHCGRKGWPDLSFIKGTDFANSCTWKVLEDYTHSDHNYILIEALFSQSDYSYQDSLRRTQKDATTPRTKNKVANATDRRKQHQRSSGEDNGRAPKVTLFPRTTEKGDHRPFPRKEGKGADKIKSYRPVTLLPTIGKVLERILLRRLNHTLKKKNILHHNQFGFRAGRSTDDAIHQLVEKIQDAKNKKLHTIVISLDIQRTFDYLQYNSIRNSLDEINFPSHTIETLKDILTDRKVTIQTAQGPVSWSQQQGCAQGSCTGPMFWNLVPNEIISEEWQPKIHLQAFADDFIFVISEPTGAKLKATAQAAFTKFQHWTDEHQLKVSTEKSTTILISRLISGPRVKWDNQIIKRSTSLKYLGIVTDNKLNRADHLINMKTKLTHLHQKITRIAGTNWGLNKDLRRRLNKTVAERMILHGAAAWAYPLSAR
ncbi:Putative protein in type-1 retrotransposable element R1DM [Araneus ventricosus]|uniref:Reverse transcriptase domain-containing protein n=1 Tax=Araneus ventricosus TaxID=182803 RepID=A0A4Y2JPT1_ARAVE|nr:Putative protein in type-1 retrotransposable element R1DM [Araneus ventricosus]